MNDEEDRATRWAALCNSTAPLGLDPGRIQWDRPQPDPPGLLFEYSPPLSYRRLDGGADGDARRRPELGRRKI